MPKAPLNGVWGPEVASKAKVHIPFPKALPTSKNLVLLLVYLGSSNGCKVHSHEVGFHTEVSWKKDDERVVFKVFRTLSEIDYCNTINRAYRLIDTVWGKD